MFDSKYKIPFNYFGSKYSYLSWLYPHFPKSKRFVDVFGGSATVVMNLNQDNVKIYNDINGDVVNFFKVLRSDHEELIRQLQLTPYSIGEYKSCLLDKHDSDIEKARKFFVRTNQSIMAAGCQNENKGWRIGKNSNEESLKRWLNKIENLSWVVEKLKSIHIENRDYRMILDIYDSEDTFFYLDPPYDLEKRTSGVKYKFDVNGIDYDKLPELLSSIKGKFAISGYDSNFMIDRFAIFNKYDGPNPKNNLKKRIENTRETLWTNYKVSDFNYTLF